MKVSVSESRRKSHFTSNSSLVVVARKAFVRIRDMKFIELVNSIEARLAATNGDKDELERAKELCQAEICAWIGDYQEAAKAYAR